MEITANKPQKISKEIMLYLSIYINIAFNFLCDW